MSSTGAEEGLASSEIFRVLILMNPSSVSVGHQMEMATVMNAMVYIPERKKSTAPKNISLDTPPHPPTHSTLLIHIN